jgi:Kef-type K+ transport system membrane component KefB
LALGLDQVPAIYVAVALTFSSTIIIVKLLSDKREIDHLHGRIAVGFLIVQDIVVVLVMIALTAFAATEGDGSAVVRVAGIIGRGLLFLGLVAAMARWVLPRLLPRLASAPELLVLFAIAWAASLAAIGETAGFSKEIGAFLAGVALASTPYREAVGARLVGLRDFLLLFFFIDLGSRLDLANATEILVPALVLSVFVLVGNPIIVMVIMGLMGYRRRTSFLAGLTVAQISEFSLILAALGLSLGHIGPDSVGLITVVGLITIGLSTYLILYSQPLFDRLSGVLRVFERASPTHSETADDEGAAVDIVVFGLGRYGGDLADHLHQRGHVVLGVDQDPWLISEWRGRGRQVVYGDAEEPELLTVLPLQTATWVVSTIPLVAINLSLLHALRHHGFQGRVVLTAHSDDDEATLRQAGATQVLRPYAAAAESAADMILGLRAEI